MLKIKKNNFNCEHSVCLKIHIKGTICNISDKITFWDKFNYLTIKYKITFILLIGDLKQDRKVSGSLATDGHQKDKAILTNICPLLLSSFGVIYEVDQYLDLDLQKKWTLNNWSRRNSNMITIFIAA